MLKVIIISQSERNMTKGFTENIESKSHNYVKSHN